MADLSDERIADALVLALNRPQKRNAFTFEMIESLVEKIRGPLEPGIRAVIITGTGGQSFSAGMDLSVLRQHAADRPSGERLRRVQRILQEAFTRLEELEIPTLAAIEGSCVGGGLELALACDLRISSSEAMFGFPEVKIGMLPDLGGTVRMARLAGPAAAKEWVLTGRFYPAARAAELGLLNEQVPPGQALSRALEWVSEFSGCGPLAQGWAKRVVDRSIGVSLREGLELEQDAMTELLPSEDLREGVEAFLARRPPNFRGR